MKPKPRNAAKTKAAILAAAQKAFAELGYSQAGIREIAAIAGVSSTLLLRYYGSKAALFEAALIEAMKMDGLLAGDDARSGFGETLTRLFLDPGVDIKPPSIIALSTGDAEARDIATRVVEQHVVVPLGKWLGPPDGYARALGIVMMAMGFVLFTRQLPLLPMRKSVEAKLGKWFAKTVQAMVDKP
ncbi:MAG TPA: TetR family transcriptional regulator [Solimonas sp.]|nr:TetR family transcriptional regulator [Solimonas sp.]